VCRRHHACGEESDSREIANAVLLLMIGCWTTRPPTTTTDPRRRVTEFLVPDSHLSITNCSNVRRTCAKGELSSPIVRFSRLQVALGRIGSTTGKFGMMTWDGYAWWDLGMHGLCISPPQMPNTSLLPTYPNFSAGCAFCLSVGVHIFRASERRTVTHGVLDRTNVGTRQVSAAASRIPRQHHTSGRVSQNHASC
jgi:hypothetical protein